MNFALKTTLDSEWTTWALTTLCVFSYIIKLPHQSRKVIFLKQLHVMNCILWVYS